MTFDEFRGFVEAEPRLAGSLKRAAAAAQAPAQTKSFDFFSTMALTTVLIMFFPIVNRILRRIGLPWLSSLERYSELWRMEFDWWVDKRYKKRGFDPVAAKAASEALAEELQKTTDAQARTAWERLVALLSKEGRGTRKRCRLGTAPQVSGAGGGPCVCIGS
ncbi:MAG: hypothetical protein Q8Q12_19760 [bacterium]|nr:hypothetical protein [bacterium]